MKKVILFHGTGGTPKHFWFPYIKKSLPKKNFKVFVPQLPHTNNPDIAKWLPFALEKCNFDRDTILVGHSAGCPLILSILENIEVKISKVILVAGYFEPLSAVYVPKKILQKEYNWEVIKKHSEQFVFINSVNDPWGCDDKQGRKVFDELGGDLIVRSNQGHMGSDKFNQPYREFPLVKFLIEN